jgi:transposase-like protein
MDMHHYQCNDCGYTWYTTLETNRCADPMCLQYNIRDLYVGPKRLFEFWTTEEIEADSERARYESSRKMTEHITQILIIEENENNGRTTKE